MNNNMKVLIADQINQKGIEELEEVAEVIVQTDITPEELLKVIKDFDGIIVRSRTKVTREVIEAASKLRIIARAGVGVDNVNVEAATERGIMVVNAPESTSITVAEHTMGLILSLARKISLADKSVKQGKWEKSSFMGMELNGKTLGIVGMGRIGSQVASRCKAFGMDLIVYDPYLPGEVASEIGVEVVDLPTLLKKADVITIHVPLTPETKHSISLAEMEMMKDSAFIVNCARGGIINEEDLYHAIKEGKIGGAALDVFENEPPVDNPLLTLENVVFTPHIGASTREAQRDAAIIVAKEIKEVLQGRSPKNVINMPVLDPKTFQEIKPYLTLSEKLGKFLIQTAIGNINELDITYCGELAKIQKTDVITRVILKEILNPILTEPVNMVNSTSIANKRGLIITEGKRTDAGSYKSSIKVEVKSDGNLVNIEGIFTKKPKIVKINQYPVDVETEGTMLICKYKDIPGIIGSIGTTLGEHNINIAKMQVGRSELGGEAVMVLKVDQFVPENVLLDIKELDNVYEASAVNL